MPLCKLAATKLMADRCDTLDMAFGVLSGLGSDALTHTLRPMYYEDSQSSLRANDAFKAVQRFL